MKKKIIYGINALYCVTGIVLVAGSLVLHKWYEAYLLFVLFLFMALADYCNFRLKKQEEENIDLTYRLKRSTFMLDHCIEECTKVKQKKLLMYNCDHCPRKSDTCQKLVYEDRTECVEPVEHFDL